MTSGPHTELLKFSLSGKRDKEKLAAQNKQAAGMIAYKDYKGTSGHIAEGLDRYSADMKQGAQGRRKRGWEYALEGLTEGVSTGLKMSAEQEKISRVMGYFQQTGDAAAQMNQQYKDKAAFTGAMAAPAKAAVPLLYSGKPYEEVNPVLGDLWNSAKLNNSSLQGDYIGFIPNTPNIIVRGNDGKEQVVSLSQYAGDELVLDEYEKSLLQKAEKDYQAEGAFKARKLNATERRNDIMEGSLGARLEGLGIRSAKELLPRAVASADTKRLAGKIIKDAKANPQIFAGTMSALMSTAGDTGAFKLWLDTTFNSPKDRDAAMRIAKNINQIKISDAKSLGGSNNQTIDQWIDAAYPSAQYSQENFLEIMQDIEEKAAYHEGIYRDTLTGRSAGHLGESFDRRTEDYNAPKATPEPTAKPAVAPVSSDRKSEEEIQEAIKNGYRWMANPDNPNERALVSKDQQDIMLSKNAVFVN